MDLKYKKIHLEGVIKTKTRRLQKLEEKKALFGFSTDPVVNIEIEDINAELTQLKRELQEINWAIDEAQIPYLAREEILRVFRQKYPTLDLTGRMMKKIPDRVFNMKHRLEKLNLGQNKISEVPGTIANLSYLEDLDLNDNRITELPSQICFLHKLKGLNLKNNQQLTTLPQDIGRLNNLSTFNIEGTGITELPLSFHKLQNLKRGGFFCDIDRMTFPCSDIIKQGAQAIVDFLGKEAEKKERFRVYLIDPKPDVSPKTKLSTCKDAVDGCKRVFGMQEVKNSPKSTQIGTVRQFTAVGFGETDEDHFQEELNKPRNKILIIEPK